MQMGHKSKQDNAEEVEEEVEESEEEEAKHKATGEVPSHEPVAHSHYCTPHLVDNVVKNIFRFVSNQGAHIQAQKHT